MSITKCYCESCDVGVDKKQATYCEYESCCHVCGRIYCKSCMVSPGVGPICSACALLDGSFFDETFISYSDEHVYGCCLKPILDKLKTDIRNLKELVKNQNDILERPDVINHLCKREILDHCDEIGLK